MEYVFPLEIWQILLNKIDFLSQIRLTQVCEDFHQVLRIENFYEINAKYLKLLTDNILKNYPYITRLDAGDNPNVKDVSHLIHLKVLNAYRWSGIGDSCLQNINLYVLYAGCNEKIKNISHMTELRILDVSGNDSCGVDDTILQHLNLLYLGASANKKIKKVGHMTNLIILDASYECGVDDSELQTLNLNYLNAYRNNKIRNISHMSKLRTLVATGFECEIDDAILQGLNLCQLYKCHNHKITKEGCKHMTNLKLYDDITINPP